jgi:flagellin-like protein
MKIIENDEAVSPGKAVTTEDAVSPVIGVILMVAITVILAAVIAAFVFGLAGTTQSTKSVGVTAKYNQGDDGTGAMVDGIQITYQGGTDDAKLLYLKVTLKNSAGTVFTMYTASSDGTTEGNELDGAAETGELGKPPVGYKYQITDGVATGTTTPVTPVVTGVSTNSITVTGKFNDGSEQVLLDTKV